MPIENPSDLPLDPQPVPDDAACPRCGGPPSDETEVRHRLQANGYLADDQTLTCADCDGEWVVGVPIGEFDGGDDLQCGGCGGRALVHHIGIDLPPLPQLTHLDGGDVTFILFVKCETCLNYWSVKRDADHRPVALVGYPAITGSIDSTENNYGYPAEQKTPPGAHDHGDDHD